MLAVMHLLPRVACVASFSVGPPPQSSQVLARDQRGVQWWECEMAQGQEVGHSQTALVRPWVSRGPGMLTCNGRLEEYPPKASAFLGLSLAAWLGPSCFSATGSTVQLLFLLLFDQRQPLLLRHSGKKEFDLVSVPWLVGAEP